MKKISFFFLLSLLTYISFAAVNAEDEVIQLAQNLPEMTKSFISQLVIMLSDENLNDTKLIGSSDAEFGHFLTEIKKLCSYKNEGFDFPNLASSLSDYESLIIIRDVIKKVQFHFLDRLMLMN